MSDRNEDKTGADPEHEKRMKEAEELIGNYNPDDWDEVAKVKNFAKMFATMVLKNVPPGRRRSIALTHIEEAAMMAVKGIFHDG